MRRTIDLKVVVIIVIFIIAIIVFVLSQNKAKDSNIENNLNEVEEVVEEEYETILLGMDNIAMGDSREEVIVALGEPESENVIETGLIDVEEIELIYDEGKTEILIRNDKVVEIHSTSTNRNFYNGARISMQQSKLEELIPSELRVQDETVPTDSIVYSNPNLEDYQYVRFVIQHEEVVEIIIAIGERDS